jgi:hypothetical protein
LLHEHLEEPSDFHPPLNSKREADGLASKSNFSFIYIRLNVTPGHQPVGARIIIVSRIAESDDLNFHLIGISIEL